MIELALVLHYNQDSVRLYTLKVKRKVEKRMYLKKRFQVRKKVV